VAQAAESSFPDAAARFEEQRRRRSEVPPAKRPVDITLRRFAGPAKHVGMLDHLRIAHLTDLHVGRVTPMRVQHAAVDLSNAQAPDLVVITGDFVCHSQAYLDQLAYVVDRLDAPVLAVLGNHDHWSGAGEVRRALRRAGAEVLDNANTTLTLRRQRLQVVGLDDAYTGHADRRKAVRGLRADLPVLGLSHIAEEADALWQLGVPLVLSGHTHAGQVTLARLHELAVGKLAGHKYVHGLYGRRHPDGRTNGAVYVGAGIGAAVVPFRFGERAKREVAIFELGHEPGSFDEHHGEQSPLPGRKPSRKKRYKRAVAVVKKSAKRHKKNRKNGSG
jgi:predicted MPP superfamily phosphohydrolase